MSKDSRISAMLRPHFFRPIKQSSSFICERGNAASLNLAQVIAAILNL